MQEVLNYSLQALILYYIIERLCEAKTLKKNRLLMLVESLVVINLVVDVDFATNFGVNVFDVPSVNRIIYSILTILIVLVFAKYNYKVKLTNLLIIALAYFLSLRISIKVAHNFYLDLINYFYIISWKANLIVNLITNLINFLIWFIVIKVIKERHYYNNLITYLPLLLAAITIAIILVMMNIPASNLTNLSLIVIIILFNYLMMYIYMQNMHKLHKQVSDQKFAIERKYYQEKIDLELNNYNRSFGFIHDLIYKLKDVEKSLVQEDIGLALNEVNDINQDLIKEFNVMYTSSKTISLVLNNHLYEFAQHNIKIKTTIKYSDFTFLDDIDAISIFDKLIKYAIAANTKCKTDYKFINISTGNKNSSIIIKFIFAKDDDDFNDLLLDDVNEIISKYHGRYLTDYLASDQYAIINISFNIADVQNNFALENQK